MPSANRVEINLGNRLAQGFGVITTVKMFVGNVVKRHLLRTNEASKAYLRWFQCKFSCQRIHHQFKRETNASPSDAAIREDGRFIGGDGIGTAAIPFEVIQAGQYADYLCGFQARREGVR